MRKLLFVLLLVLPTFTFADNLGFITETTVDSTHFGLSVFNTSSTEFTATLTANDLLGNAQSVGPFDCTGGFCDGTAFGNYATTGNWTATITTALDTFDITGGFAAIGDSLTVQIDTPAPPPPPPSSTPEPSTLTYLAITTPFIIRKVRSRPSYRHAPGTN